MTKSYFLTIIGNHQAKLAEVVHNAVSTYPSTYADSADVHSKRSQASLIHDHMVRRALECLPEKYFKLLRAKGRNLFSFEDQVLLQFKKLKPNLKSSNYPTKQAELFEEVGEVDGLPGLPATIPLITVGYVAKRFLAGIEGIFVTQTINRRLVWSHRLDDENRPPNISSILTPNEPTRDPKRTRIRRTGGGKSSTKQASS